MTFIFKEPTKKINNLRTCYVCKEAKDISLFGPNATRTGGYQTYCKACAKAKQTEWYYSRKHGITLATRDAMLANQSGKCLICEQDIAFKINNGHGKNIGNEAVVDHCHINERIRGVLCGHCNTGLGAFKDNKKYLKNAIDYLTKTGTV